jgi:hypothetical protein
MAAKAGRADDVQVLTLHVPFRVTKRGGRKLVVVPDGPPAEHPRIDSALVKALARAFRWQRMLESGEFVTLQDLAVAEKINPSYLSRVLRLTLLAPEVVEAILDGRQGEGVTLAGVMDGVEVEWGKQSIFAWHC